MTRRVRRDPESNFKDRTTQTALDPLAGSRFVPGRFLLTPAGLLAFDTGICSPRPWLESRHIAPLSSPALFSPALSSESSCFDARLDNGDAGDLDALGVRLPGVGDIALEDVADRGLRVGVPALRSS